MPLGPLTTRSLQSGLEATMSVTRGVGYVHIFIITIPKSQFYTMQTNVTQAGFHSIIMDTYFNQLSLLYSAGARSFVLLTVPPIDRAPLFLSQGRAVTKAVDAAVKDYNKQLNQRAEKFAQTNRGASVRVYETATIFNTVLDNGKQLGYVNVTGYAEPYANGIAGTNAQVEGYAPVSSYFWLNSLHPVWPFHA